MDRVVSLVFMGETLMHEKYPSNWVTTGWSRVNGKWEEMGGVTGVREISAPKPTIEVHEVADIFNWWFGDLSYEL